MAAEQYARDREHLGALCDLLTEVRGEKRDGRKVFLPTFRCFSFHESHLCVHAGASAGGGGTCGLFHQGPVGNSAAGKVG